MTVQPEKSMSPYIPEPLKEVRCSACNSKFFVTEAVSGKPVEIYEHCWTCRRWNKAFEILAYCFLLFSIAIVGLWLLIHKKIDISLSSSLSVFGLAFDIAGVVFLLGNLEKVLISAGVRGAHTVISKELPKHVRKTRAGLILVILGFVLQLVGSVLNG